MIFRLFRQETEKADVLNEELGMGIGLFQGATNLFLNGIVLGVLYGGAQMIKTGVSLIIFVLCFTNCIFREKCPLVH